MTQFLLRYNEIWRFRFSFISVKRSFNEVSRKWNQINDVRDAARLHADIED